MSQQTKRDPRDLTQYCLLKWWQFWLYTGLLFLSGALFGFGLAFAPAARADPADDVFLTKLHNAGFTWQDPQVIINNGHTACLNLWSGTQTFEDQVTALRGVTPELSEAWARSFVSIAITSFCPDISARRKVVPE